MTIVDNLIKNKKQEKLSTIIHLNSPFFLSGTSTIFKHHIYMKNKKKNNLSTDFKKLIIKTIKLI